MAMDLIEQIRGLKGRGQRKRAARGRGSPSSGTPAPDPGELVRRLDGAEILSLPGGHLIVRRVEHPLPDSPEAISALLRSALGVRVEPREIIALDTETTGLAGGTGTVAFMVGMARFEGDGLVIEQALMPDYPDEPALLHWLGERLESCGALISFNGKTFDLPLLRTRRRLQGEGEDWTLPHLDMLHVARRLFAHRLSGCGLAHIEQHILNTSRVGDLPGRLAPKAYFRYLEGHEIDLMAEVFRHNERDLVSTATLLARVAAFHAQPERMIFGDPGDWQGLGEWVEQMHDLERAREIFSLALGALRDTPLRTKLELRLADLSVHTGREEEALDLWRSVAERDPLSGWPAVREIARWNERRERWRAAFAVLDAAWARFEQVKGLRAHGGRSRLPRAWRQWMNECEKMRKDLRQAAGEEQLTLF
ncbi:ribonuclease H-like domain-containing protein [Candidatus Sumerlaeota bacterium]|nr:ribonuclease H-like domain-containing protein [Candidatus Sumerlaeota bacterium]